MKSYKRIEAVRKAGEILKYLASQKVPVTSTDVSGAINLPHGTVMCHLTTLEELGFVQNVGDYWRLGMGLSLMWARVKSTLEGDRMKIESQLKELEGGENEDSKIG